MCLILFPAVTQAALKFKIFPNAAAIDIHPVQAAGQSSVRAQRQERDGRFLSTERKARLAGDCKVGHGQDSLDFKCPGKSQENSKLKGEVISSAVCRVNFGPTSH